MRLPRTKPFEFMVVSITITSVSVSLNKQRSPSCPQTSASQSAPHPACVFAFVGCYDTSGKSNKRKRGELIL